MRTSCGRSDGEPTTQAKEVTRWPASARNFPSAAIYYNRLEYDVGFRFFCAAARSSAGSPLVAANPPSRDVAAAPSPIDTPWAFLSLLQVRESCDKVLRGVTPIRRGIV
jgi:hypothetical protein